MPLYSFEIFAAIARYSNLTRASADLHISQPALTQRLKHLERQYKAKLYKKTRNGIELTEPGKLLRKFAERTLKQHERLQQKLSRGNLSVVNARPLSIGGSYSPSVALLPLLLARFRKAHPHVELCLTTNNKKEIQRRIENSEVEIAVINNPQPSRSLICEPYLEEQLVAFVSPTHALARKKTIALRDLVDTPLVIRQGAGGNGTAEQILRRLEQQGVKMEIAMRCESPHTLKEAVRRDVGLGILFKTTVDADIKRGDFKRITLAGLKPVGQSFIVYHRNKPLTPTAREFLELLRQEKQARERRRPRRPPR